MPGKTELSCYLEDVSALTNKATTRRTALQTDYKLPQTILQLKNRSSTPACSKARKVLSALVLTFASASESSSDLSSSALARAYKTKIYIVLSRFTMFTREGL